MVWVPNDAVLMMTMTDAYGAESMWWYAPGDGKCSFCVQRLQDGKLRAKKENRVITDGDTITACQQACPTEAIVFGNANNSKSVIVKTRQENEQRLYHVLEELHVLPNISYLARVRNSESEAKEKS